MQQYVVWLEIPMHYIVFGENPEGFQNLPSIHERPPLREGPLANDEFIQGAPIAEFIHKIKVVGGFEHVDVLDNKLALFVQGGKNVDFINGALFQFGNLHEFFHLDHLDGYFLFGFDVDCFVHLGVHALP